MSHEKHSFLSHHKWELGLIAGLGGIITAPYIATALSSETKVGNVMAVLHGEGLGTGLAGAINTGISHIPYIGNALVSTPYLGVIATAGIGIGGILLANYLEKKEAGQPAGKIRWSKVIRYASLATSLLIALPSILTGLSVGISFLAIALGGVAFGSQVLGVMGETLGSAGAQSTGSLFAATLPHLITCGGALIPLGLRSWLSSRSEATEKGAVDMRLVAAETPVVGKPCELAFQLVDQKSGKPLTAADLEVTHTKKLHTMIVDASLRDYHHLHPYYDANKQLFICKFTPNSSMPYTAWHDFRRSRNESNTQVMTELPASRKIAFTPSIVPSSSSTAGGVSAAIEAPAPLRAGSDGMLNIRLSGPDGQPLNDLEPIMGAYAHLVGFSADGKHFIHCHPMGEEPKDAAARGAGTLQFHISPEIAGGTKFFLQIRRNGEEITLPFGQMVLPPAKLAERVSQPPAHQHAMLAVG